MKICLDTNAYSRLVGGDTAVAALLERAEEIIVPSTVIGELFYGFLNGSRPSENETRLERFLAEDGISVQPTTKAIAERYGYVKSSLKKRGNPIPENDIWIAAAALETGSRLLSYDVHFDQVAGIIRLTP